MDYIVKLLNANRDEKYADFHSRLIPTVDKERILGVRTPVLRSLARDLLKDKDFCDNILPEFLNELPHFYYDENTLHGEFISKQKDFDKAVELTEEFLPHIDNWAVCDMLDPKVFGKHKEELFALICKWLDSGSVYTVRFGIDMMLKHFLDDNFRVEHLPLVLNAKGDDYYIKMAKAWYFSFAFIKHYNTTLDFFKSVKMDEWIFKKSIQKSRESFRLTAEQKEELKLLLKHE